MDVALIFTMRKCHSMNKGLTTLLKTKNAKSLLKMFDRKKTSRSGMLWATLLGLGVSAAAMIAKNHNTGNEKIENPIKNTMNHTPETNASLPPNLMAMAAEFSKELGIDDPTEPKN